MYIKHRNDFLVHLQLLLELDMLRFKLRQSGVELRTDPKEYSVAEFYDTFQHRLPQVVKVTQGFPGDNTYSTIFNKNQVIFINAIAKQARVLARFQSAKIPMLFSLPETCLVCLFENGKYQRENNLFDILKHHALPLNVKFPRNLTRKVAIGIGTPDVVSPLHLTHVFQEVNMLGNFVNIGQLSKFADYPNFVGPLTLDVLHIPLYLPQLRVSVVTGIVNEPLEGWASFLEELKGFSYEIEYDVLFGIADIAEYSTDNTFPGNSYSYIQPKAYVNIDTLMDEAVSKENTQDKDIITKTTQAADSVYENPEADSVYEISDADSDYEEPVQSTVNVQPETRNVLDQARAISVSKQPEVAGVYEEPESDRNYAQIDESECSINLEIKLIESGKNAINAENEKTLTPLRERIKSGLELNRTKRLTNKFQEMQPHLELAKEQKSKLDLRHTAHLSAEENNKCDHSSKGTYLNDLPRTEIQPTRRQQEIYQNDNSRTVTGEKKRLSTGISMTNAGLRCVTTSKDVAKLTISEVGEYLKKLNLGDHIEKFRDQLIDGALLVEMDRGMLQNEFGFSPVEALRLVKFAKDGHVPI